jgi:hypothetical protein
MVDPSLTDFYVHTRMPKRLGIQLQIDRLPADGMLPVQVRAGRRTRPTQARDYIDERLPVVDVLADGLVVQVT